MSTHAQLVSSEPLTSVHAAAVASDSESASMAYETPGRDASLGAGLGARCLPTRIRNSWRALQALTDIERGYRDPEFDAKAVARTQSISRRRLDEVLLRETGASLTAHIWRRRLQQAAADLRDGSQVEKSVSAIAFDLGFQQLAHFSRAFKKHFAVTPTHWRRAQRLASPHKRDRMRRSELEPSEIL